MKLEEAFERVIVINLPFRDRRRSRLEANLEISQIAKPAALTWERGVCGDLTPPPTWWGAGNGAWGCLMSHLRIAQDAAHDKVASYCVLEDDVVFHPRAAEMLEHFMKNLPADWGQAYLGGQFLHRQPERVNDWVVRPYNVNRTHAFALAKNTIPRYLQHIMNAPDYFELLKGDDGATSLTHNHFHIDHQLGRAHERQEWNTYAPIWWIAGQEDGPSTISGRVNPQLWWHWRDRGHGLPVFYLPQKPGNARRELGRRYLHAGYNLKGASLTDTTLTKKLDDNELLAWLTVLAEEAIERWKLPGFEVPKRNPDLVDRVRALWEPGVLPVEDSLMVAAADYPFNGLCGGSPLPHF